MTHSSMAIKQILLIGMVFGEWACTSAPPSGEVASLVGKVASPARIVRKASEYTIREVTKYPTPCTPSPEIRVKSTKPTITISYREPTSNKDGTPLTDLKWTTIYFGLKKDSVKAIDVWTNNDGGRGSVEIQDIPIPVKQNEEVLEVLCVTATDWSGNEEPPPR
jgi:hypothetical protein